MNPLRFIEVELQRVEFEMKVLERRQRELIAARAELCASMTPQEWADLKQLDDEED